MDSCIVCGEEVLNSVRHDDLRFGFECEECDNFQHSRCIGEMDKQCNLYVVTASFDVHTGKAGSWMQLSSSDEASSKPVEVLTCSRQSTLRIGCLSDLQRELTVRTGSKTGTNPL